MIEPERAFRADQGRILSALIRALGDFDLAEESLQEAFAAAADRWRDAPPRNARGWLYGTALHKGLDRLRSARRQAARLAELPEPEPALQREEEEVPDERLRLLFTCCHPALPLEGQVALTLRTLCGLSTEAIARAFLVPGPTMAQRLVRAKAKIREAGIPYVVPGAEELPARLDGVLAVLYLVFNEGHFSSGEMLLRRDLCSEAISLTRVLRSLLPGRPPVDALLALMLLSDSRRDARLDERGEVVLLPEQDRSRWDRAAIAEAEALLEGALRDGPPGTYALEAAIAAVHAGAATAAETDWPQIAALYDRLLCLHPSPVVALNRAVAVAMAEGPEAGLRLVDELAGPLGSYHLWHAARADLLRRLGRRQEALAAYGRALELSANGAEQRFLRARIDELSG